MCDFQHGAKHEHFLHPGNHATQNRFEKLNLCGLQKLDQNTEREKGEEKQDPLSIEQQIAQLREAANGEKLSQEDGDKALRLAAKRLGRLGSRQSMNQA